MAMAGMCGVCGGTDMTSGGDGFSYCNQCGSQSQFFLDEAFDNDDGLQMFNARYVREKRVTRNELMAGAAAAMDSQPQASLLAAQEELILQASQFNPQFASQQFASQQFGSQYGAFSQAPPPASDPLTAAAEETQQLGLSESDKLAAKVRRVYVEGMQTLVQMQCEALVQRWGVNPLVCGVLGPVWMKFLASTCVFEKGWAEESLLVAELCHARGETEEPADDAGPPKSELDEDEKPNTADAAPREKKLKRKRRKRQNTGEPWTSYGEKARYVWLRNLKARIPLRASLAITYLACHLAREPVLPTDIINWAFEGTLPYLSAHAEIERRANWGPDLLLLRAKTMFKPLRMTNARVVEYLASMVADRIGLTLPSVNFPAIARRFLPELGLPVARFAPAACRIFEWFPSSGLWLSTQVASLPTRLYVMAMLVIVFKLFYKLDGRHGSASQNTTAGRQVEVEMGALNLREDDEDEWRAADFMAKMRLVLRDDLELVGGQEKLTAYLRYCREIIFSGVSMSTDEEQLRDHFWELYEKSAKQDAAGRKTSGAETVENRPGQAPPPLTSAAVAGREMDSNSHENGAKVVVGKPASKASKLRKAPAAADPLLRGAEDLGFVILAPVKDPAAGGDEYLRYQKPHVGKYHVHDDYFVVLRACARVADVEPRALHAGVVNVERGLVQAETGIARFLAPRDPASPDGRASPDEMEEG